MHRLFSIIFSFLFLCVETTTTTANQLAAVGGRGDYNKCFDKERLALLQFKSSLQDPYGNDGCLSTWTTEEEDCCNWSGVTCNNRTSHVIELDLGACDIVGEISHSLLNLTNLKYLGLSDNSFSGTIPEFIGSMTQLIHLDLFLNSFSGTIPEFIGSMTQLIHLDLSVNSFSGTVPPEFGNLTNLQELWLGQVGRCRVENIEWLSRLSHLEQLQMDGISLAKQNHWVDVILSLPNLSFLSLEGCELSHVMYPYSSSVLNSSSSSSIANTGISDTIPFQFWDMWPHRLQHLDLSSNNISGEVPDLLSNFNDYSVIDLSSNRFYGPIPNVSSTVTSLNLSRNNFSGGISFLCQIVGGFLEFLDLSQNLLSGQLPDCLWNFKELTVVDLGNNNFSGRLPNSLKSLFKLEVLDLYNNEFSGELPLSLQNCTSLNVLNLGANKFSGNVPIWIGENISGLYVLILTSNKFFGTIPLQLCQLANLHILDLSMNNLHGTIPSCVNNLTAMVQEGPLQYQNQHDFWGVNRSQNFPLTYFDHAMIGWQGVEREFFSNLILLKMIDLSSNNLTGQIPYEITNLHDLIALNLSKNALHGEIPQKIGQMTKLLVLDLSRNKFSGGIPTSMSQMTFLSYLDVSSNNLSGRIPSSTQLQSFDSSRYDGNIGLCGLPLPQKCQGDEEPQIPSVVGKTESDGEDKDEDWGWFYIGIGTGFATGFWIVCGTLLVNRRGRHVFFHFYDSFKDWVYVKVVVFIANLKKDEHR